MTGAVKLAHFLPPAVPKRSRILVGRIQSWDPTDLPFSAKADVTRFGGSRPEAEFAATPRPSNGQRPRAWLVGNEPIVLHLELPDRIHQGSHDGAVRDGKRPGGRLAHRLGDDSLHVLYDEAGIDRV